MSKDDDNSTTTQEFKWPDYVDKAQKFLVEGAGRGMGPYLKNPTTFVAPPSHAQDVYGYHARQLADLAMDTDFSKQLGDYTSQFMDLAGKGNPLTGSVGRSNAGSLDGLLAPSRAGAVDGMIGKSNVGALASYMSPSRAGALDSAVGSAGLGMLAPYVGKSRAGQLDGAVGDAKLGLLNSYIPGYSAQSIASSTIGNRDIDQFANPFAEKQMDSQIGRVNDAYKSSQADIGARAAAGGAFGGSGEAIQRSMLDKNRMKEVNEIASQVGYDSYNTGASLARGNADARTSALQAAGNDIYGRAQGSAQTDANQINDRFNRAQGAAAFSAGQDDALYGRAMGSANFDASRVNDHFNRQQGAAAFDSAQDAQRFGQGQASANYDSAEMDRLFGRGMSAAGFNAGQDDAAFGRGHTAAQYDASQVADQFGRASGAAQFGMGALQAGANYNVDRFGAMNAGMNDYFGRNAGAMGMLGQAGALDRSYQQQLGDRDYTTFLRMQGLVPGVQAAQVTTAPNQNPSLAQQAAGFALSYPYSFNFG